MIFTFYPSIKIISKRLSLKDVRNLRARRLSSADILRTREILQNPHGQGGGSAGKGELLASADKGEEGQFFAVCADVFYGRPQMLCKDYKLFR